MVFRKKTTAEKLEADVADIARRKLGLERRVAEVQAELDAAHGERRALLTGSDDPDPRDLAKADAAARSATDRKVSLDEAVMILAARLSEAEGKVAAERARVEREGVADERAAMADTLAATAATLESACAAAALAYDRFRVAAHEALPPSDEYPMGAGILIGEVRGHLLHHLFPSEFASPALATAATTNGAVEVAARALRTEAERMREGRAAVIPLRRVPRPVPPATFPEVPIALSREAYFRNAYGQTTQIFPGGVVVPEPIATAAIAAGIGFGAETVPGKAIIRIVQNQPAARIESDGQGSFRGVAFTGLLGEKGGGIDPAPPPVDLGMLPDADGVILAEAAQ